MIITKYIHSCLLVETPDRVAIFDPGVMSFSAFDVDKLTQLDDIFVTHIHQDHIYIPFMKELIRKFPNARVTSTDEVVQMLQSSGIKASSNPPEGVVFFNAPHESVEPLFSQPEEIGIHYLNTFTNPGDSHSFNETKEVLALPITAPWGSSIKALNLTLELKPKYVIPIHDWHWNDQARQQAYEGYSEVLAKENIIMLKPITGQSMKIDV